MHGKCWCIEGLAAHGARPGGVPAATAAAEVADGDLVWSQWVVVVAALGRVGHVIHPPVMQGTSWPSSGMSVGA